MSLYGPSLQDVKAGRSTTVVNVPLKALLNGKYAINLHRSAEKMKVYVACGDITTQSAPAQTFTQGED